MIEAKSSSARRKTKSPFASLRISPALVRESHGSAIIILQLSLLELGQQHPFPSVARVVADNNFDVGPAQEQACAILEAGRKTGRWVAIKMESCTGLCRLKTRLPACRGEFRGTATDADTCFLPDWSLMRAPSVPGKRARRMPETMLANSSLRHSMTQTPHKARSLATTPPGTDQALPLLAEIATAPCPFAPRDPPSAAGALWCQANSASWRAISSIVPGDWTLSWRSTATLGQLAEEPAWTGVPFVQPDEVTGRGEA